MRFAVLITGHIRDGLKYKYIKNIINILQEKGECDIYGYIPENLEHNTKTWHPIDQQMINKKINLNELYNYINFKKIMIYQEKDYNENEKKILWGKSPLSYIGVQSMWNAIYNCLKMIDCNNNYDYIFRMRFDYYKFDYASYSQNICDILKNYNYDISDDKIVSIKVKHERGEDMCFFGKSIIFKRNIEYIFENFEQIEKQTKNLPYDKFMPEYIIHYSCIKNNVLFLVYE
jgi:hypothetical protein